MLASHPQAGAGIRLRIDAAGKLPTRRRDGEFGSPLLILRIEYISLVVVYS
jgi:hypothetical protein